jgi:hypothetical protein
MPRVRNLVMALSLLPALVLDSRARRLLSEMRVFCRRLPGALSGQPLLKALAALNPAMADLAAGADGSPANLSASTIRKLADLAALMDRRSPLGVCMRRSLTRYHYLRRAGLPVEVQFGARFLSGKPDREISGHAWLTLDGEPYYEDGENYSGFTVMLTYPRA